MPFAIPARFGYRVEIIDQGKDLPLNRDIGKRKPLWRIAVKDMIKTEDLGRLLGGRELFNQVITKKDVSAPDQVAFVRVKRAGFIKVGGRNDDFTDIMQISGLKEAGLTLPWQAERRSQPPTKFGDP